MGQKYLGGPSLYFPRKEKDYGIASMVRIVSLRVQVTSYNKENSKIKWLEQDRSLFLSRKSPKVGRQPKAIQCTFSMILSRYLGYFYIVASLTVLECVTLTCTFKLGSPSHFCVLVPEGEKGCVEGKQLIFIHSI